jgi:hypothetical protein
MMFRFGRKDDKDKRKTAGKAGRVSKKVAASASRKKEKEAKA